jgi:hypothetical protein
VTPGKVLGPDRQLPSHVGRQVVPGAGIDSGWRDIAIDLVDAAVVALVENRDAER